MADDVMAQTFLVAFERRLDFRVDQQHAAPWLHGIANNLIRRHRRDEVPSLRALERSGPGPGSFEVASAVAARLDAGQAVRDLAPALRKMSRAQRETVLLHAWTDLTYEEIAEAMGVPIGTVRSRLSRARDALRTATNDASPGDPGSTTDDTASAGRKPWTRSRCFAAWVRTPPVRTPRPWPRPCSGR